MTHAFVRQVWTQLMTDVAADAWMSANVIFDILKCVLRWAVHLSAHMMVASSAWSAQTWCIPLMDTAASSKVLLLQ